MIPVIIVLKKGIQIVITEFRLSPAGKVKH